MSSINFKTAVPNNVVVLLKILCNDNKGNLEMKLLHKHKFIKHKVFNEFIFIGGR